MSTYPFGRPAALALAVLVLAVPTLTAADDKVFTQKPELASGQASEPLAPPAEKDSPRADLFTRGQVPAWIWGPDANKRYVLRHEFTSTGTPETWLKATCDNRFTLFLNGKEVARGEQWQAPVSVEVTKFLKDGSNELLAEVANEGGQAGFVLKLVATPSGAKPFQVITSGKWQALEKKGAEKGGPARVVGKLGDKPWGDVFTQGGPGRTAAASAFKLLPGFQVERLYTVPKDKLGSWVCITFDDKGRLLASDQGNLGLCRITPPKPGSDEPTKVERLDVKMTAAQGMLHAFGSLYCSVNGGPGSGLYRLRDTNGDDQYDEVVKLKAFQGGGEHGPHALRLSPDGKSILVMGGNHTRPPENFDASRVPRNWSEDLLLPRQWDANGHARGILAPGGWVARTDPDGKTWEMVSIGYRNAYDMAFNADGELFGYDSDMEWDMGMPWYRPTRVNHAVSGSEFGWRSGTGVWPAHHLDSLPPMIDIGPGSPVGVEFGYGTKFPAKYQKALYICDWTFGTIYALHLEPDGSTYRATKEEFISRAPLPLTDVAAGPDGALYFTVGGRGTQSELFRVTYTGKEPTARAEYADARGAELRALRRQLEQYHVPSGAAAVEFAFPRLGHEDRFIRYAARVALEHQKADLWQDRVLAAKDALTLLNGAVALARQGDKALQPKLLAALDRLDFGTLTEARQLDLLRVYSLVFLRMGEPDKETAARIAKKLDAFYPAKSDTLNRELVQMLVYLKSPTVVAKTIALMKQPSPPPSKEAIDELLARNRGYGGTIAKMLANAPDLQKLHYAFVLRNAHDGWTAEQRKVYFTFLSESRGKSGGSSYQGFINNMEKDAFDNATDVERLAIEAAGLRKPFRPKELPKAQGPGREWNLDELVKIAEPKLKGRDFKNGLKMYAAARCVVCHRFNGEGGATGPDLTQLAGRFSLKDLSEALVEPSKVVSDQYRASTVATKGGKFYTGKIVSETNELLTIVIDPEDSTKVAEVKKGDVDVVQPSPVSLMPADLLKQLNENEVLDLLAYLLSRGDPGHAMFKK